NRYGVEVKVNQQGPSGEPMTELTYRTAGGAALFVRQWVPVNPDMEILSGSRPIQTKWGKGWLLTQAKSLIAEWVDIGPLRVSLFTNNLNLVSREELVQIGDTLGPASGRQVFTFVVDRPAVKDVPLPPPVEAQINGEGVQELTLVVTPGGYSPIRFAVKKGIPVRITFKQLGPVGCGNDLTLPTDGENAISLHLESEADKDVAEFTPQQAGDFKFHCPHDMYRGIMTVRE
ncbi:MAG: cupredoxin domain-containing protein, partial [Rudaea sp.]